MSEEIKTCPVPGCNGYPEWQEYDAILHCSNKDCGLMISWGEWGKKECINVWNSIIRKEKG